MMKIMTLILMGAFSAPLLSPKTYSYEIKEIEFLKISAGVEFAVRCGNMNKLEISADSKDDFRVSYKNEKLEITRRGSFLGWLHSPGNVTAELTLQNLPQSMRVSAGSAGGMKNCFKNEESFSLSVSSGSSFLLDGGSGSLDQLEVNVSSGGTVEMRESFHINRMELGATSGSTFEAGTKVVVEEAAVKISSGASAEICGALTVSGRASSGSDVKVSDNTMINGFSTNSGASYSNCRY
jgi:hypothetical protein